MITDEYNRTSHAPAPPEPYPRYCVVIPAWNESKHIEQTLKALTLAQATLRCNGEVVVVDNNSTDDTAVKAQAMGARVVFEPVNQIARARNSGAAATNAGFLIFLDADTTINATLLQLTIDTLASGDAIGGGSVVALDRELKGAVKCFMVSWNWFSKKMKMAAGCYMFCTHEAFNAVGGFDEKQYAAEELVLSRALCKLAKAEAKRFVIIDQAPVISSARKLEWYTTRQKLGQLLLLLIPGATRSKSKLGMWYDRSRIENNNN